MMTAIRRFFGSNVTPVTHNDVPAAPREPEREQEIKSARADLVGSLMTVERRAWEIRHELAGNVLNIVSGDK